MGCPGRGPSYVLYRHRAAAQGRGGREGRVLGRGGAGVEGEERVEGAGASRGKTSTSCRQVSRKSGASPGI